MELTNPGVIRELLERHGFFMKKKFGQNFLINPMTVSRIAEEGCGGENIGILEIGPGIGTMTVELAKRARKVVAVEIDDKLIPLLEETLAEYENVKVINRDVMKLDICELIKSEFSDCDRVSVCANLPYYITTPILMMLIEAELPLRSITVMIQKEVADRICSDNLEGDYGAITATIGYYGRAKKLFNVTPGNFFPPPKVTSTVVRIDVYEEKPYPVDDTRLLSRVIKGSFAQRRKTLVNSLSSEISELNREELSSVLSGIGIDPGVRGEKLSVKDFAEITHALSKKLSQ